MQSVITPDNQKYFLPATECGCGATSTYGHVVYIGFLEYDRDAKPTTGQDGNTGWYNWLAYVMAQHPVIHVQIFLKDGNTFLSYSADKTNGVACFTTRGITGKWRFIEMRVTREQELAIRNFYASQTQKPFDFWGTFWLYTPFPRRTTGERWFCSELCVAALQNAGLLKKWRDAWTVKPHILYIHLTGDFAEARVDQMNCNPAIYNAAATSGSLNFDFGLSARAIEYV